MKHTAAAEAKYSERRAQMILTPVTCHLSPDSSHSLSGSHLIDRHAARTWMVRMVLVTPPKRVITVDAVLVRMADARAQWRKCRWREGRSERRRDVRQTLNGQRQDKKKQRRKR